MRSFSLSAAGSLLLISCGGANKESDAAQNEAAPPPSAAAAKANPAASTPRWELRANGEGSELALISGTEPATVRLSCSAGGKSLLVNIPGFRPIGSEERLSVGSGDEATALVADPRGDGERGGVSASGSVPDNLAVILKGPVSASYGAQTSGPHPAPPPEAARDFVKACTAGPGPIAGAGPPDAGPCLMQDGKRLEVAPLRAIGTEPFWGARIEGRCVTYSHPDDQKGTRIWTRYAPRPGGGTWSGTLAGKPFELRTHGQAGCSDGMSDKRYPIAVELVVEGETRTGCAQAIDG
jgi:uncharacterized membrane protein